MESSINPNKNPLYWKWISGETSRQDNRGHQIHNEPRQLSTETTNASLTGEDKSTIINLGFS